MTPWSRSLDAGSALVTKHSTDHTDNLHWKSLKVYMAFWEIRVCFAILDIYMAVMLLMIFTTLHNILPEMITAEEKKKAI